MHFAKKHCNIALQPHSLDYSKTPKSNAYWKRYQVYTVQLTCQTLHQHSLNTTMLITSLAHQFSPNKSNGFEASDCCTSGWTASPGGGRAYTHCRSDDHSCIQRFMSGKFTCLAPDPCCCHTYENADSLIRCQAKADQSSAGIAHLWGSVCL